MRVKVTKVIRAPGEVVYERVRQLDRMPDRSPEAERFEWLDGTPGSAGAAFRGWNRTLGLSWWTNGWITEAEAPQRFVFETGTIYGDRRERTNRWSYDLAVTDGGTKVTETLQTLRLPLHLKLLGPFLALRWIQIRAGMRTTLQRLAHECESVQSPTPPSSA